jgi:hypothetical protein
MTIVVRGAAGGDMHATLIKAVLAAIPASILLM